MVAFMLNWMLEIVFKGFRKCTLKCFTRQAKQGNWPITALSGSLGSLGPNTLPCQKEDSLPQSTPGNAHSCAISKLPHGKQTNFARTSAVCLISESHSELGERI